MAENRRVSNVARALFAACLLIAPAFAQDDLATGEQQAFQAAVARVAPSVVRIETVGGLDRVGKQLASTAATTGLIVSPDGEIITSSFNFAQKPTSILVTLPDGSRHGAKVVATDHNRFLTLLKIDASSLVVPQAAPEEDFRVGQWAIAIGRTFDAERPNVSVGIVSGVKRVSGKAIQTDAKISPANYGGPLVDIEGRVMGILVPLSPDSNEEVAGVEWYDSGIGFAIPLAHVLRVLPKLREGDLRSGVLGVNLKAGSMFGEPAELLGVRPNSPAAKAGLKAGDVIVEIEGQPVERQAQLKSLINPRYAGETLALAVKRGDERLTFSAELVAELQPYAHPFLGVLPLRSAAPTNQGIPVRYVYPASPAAQAGIQPGDVITKLAGGEVANLATAWEKLSALGPGESLAVTFRRGTESREATVTLASLPESIPAELPPAHEERPAAENRPALGQTELSLAEFPNKCLVYIPEDFEATVPHGIVLWLHGAGGISADELIARWKPVCEARDLILVAPQSADPAAWKPTELEFIKKALAQAIKQYAADPARVVAAGEGGGGVLAYVIGFADREHVRGIVAVNGAAAGRVAENEPLQRLAIYAADAAKSRFQEQSQATIKKLRELKFPVTTRDLGEAERSLSADELLEVGRWIDTLDRL